MKGWLGFHEELRRGEDFETAMKFLVDPDGFWGDLAGIFKGFLKSFDDGENERFGIAGISIEHDFLEVRPIAKEEVSLEKEFAAGMGGTRLGGNLKGLNEGTEQASKGEDSDFGRSLVGESEPFGPVHGVVPLCDRGYLSCCVADLLSSRLAV